MPYEGEFARYLPLRRITETERVQQLLRRAKKQIPSTIAASVTPQQAPPSPHALPAHVVAIDGSNAEVDVETGYPGAKVGYCTVASVLLNLRLMDELDEHRPADPKRFREIEDAASVDAALPGSNVVTRDHGSAKASFREALFDVFHDVIVDEDDRTPLLATYEALLSYKPATARQSCPYDDRGCEEHVAIPVGNTPCPCSKARTFWSTDALRIHERFRDVGTNGEALGLVMQVWERVLLVHLLRCFESRKWLGRIQKVAFILGLH